MAARRSAGRLLVPAALVALALFMTGCGATAVTGDAGTGTATPTSGPHGTLSVDVVAGPTCPVEQAEDPCPPARVTNRPVTISTPAGAVVATVTTDAQGHFTIALAPGAYVIQVAIIPGTPGMRQDTPGDVTIMAGQTTSMQITLDTGIR